MKSRRFYKVCGSHRNADILPYTANCFVLKELQNKLVSKSTFKASLLVSVLAHPINKILFLIPGIENTSHSKTYSHKSTVQERGLVLWQRYLI